MNFPIITLEIQGMKNTIRTALMERVAAMDSGVQAALDKLCTEENVARIVEDEARRQIEQVPKEEVRNFFSWSSAGRAAVREAVHEHMARIYPHRVDDDMPLDGSNPNPPECDPRA